MLKDKISILISSCDAFSDLWEEHIKQFRKFWEGEQVEVYLVTDKQTDREIDGVKLIVIDDGSNMPMRIKKAIEYVGTEYVLLTLDDYFVIDKIESEKILKLVELSENYEIYYLSIYNRRRARKGKYTDVEILEDLDTTKKYTVNLYPAIWNVEFLKSTVVEDMSPWNYEVTLSKMANKQGAICKYSNAGVFKILDVVRKGKVLHPAKKYFKKNGIDIGNRPTISRMVEFKLNLMDFIKWYTPKWFSRFLKKIAKLFGMKFFSED